MGASHRRATRRCGDRSNWNGAPFCIRAIESLLASPYPALRVLLVDNGSSADDLGSIVRRYPQIDVPRCAFARRRLAVRPIVRAWGDFFAGRCGGHVGAWASGYRPPEFSIGTTLSLNGRLHP
jgi:hypothetical protein